MKAVKKAYEIDRNKIDEGYLYSEMLVYADSEKKARVMLLNRHFDIVVKKTDKEATYITIPIIRAKRYDKYMFEGKEMTQYEIADYKRELQRKAELEAIMNNEDIQFCYIKKNGYYYCSNYKGYSEYMTGAGIYPKQEAVSEAKSVSAVSIYPINISEHNEMINKKIEELKTKLISIN